MDKQKKIWLAALAVVFVAIAVMFLFLQGTYEPAIADDVYIEEKATEITATDFDISEENVVAVSSSEQGVQVSGEGVAYGNGKLLITKPGTYLLKGRLDGSLEIFVYADESVHLVLDGFEIYALTGPALSVKSASKVVITTKEGSVNTVLDTASRRKHTDLNGCIYSVADLTFNGTGTLDVRGNYQDAIVSKGTIKFVEGTYTVWAADDGIRGRDGVVIVGGTYDLQSEGTAIKSTHGTNEKKGSVVICGGEFSIISGEHAVSAVQNLQVENCRMRVRSIQEAFLCKGQKSIAEGCVNDDGVE